MILQRLPSGLSVQKRTLDYRKGEHHEYLPKDCDHYRDIVFGRLPGHFLGVCVLRPDSERAGLSQPNISQ